MTVSSNIVKRNVFSPPIAHSCRVFSSMCYRLSFTARRQKASTEYYETQRRYNYVTPKSYLELIGFYKFLLDQKRTEVQRQIDRLDVGLSTLRKTAADVAELQVDLTHTMVKVQEASSSARLCIFIFCPSRRCNVIGEVAAWSGHTSG